MKTALSTVVALLLLLLLSGCGKSHVHASHPGVVHDSAPRADAPHPPAKLPDGRGGYRKTGKPYKISGRWYYPLATADGYNETGVASWYGTKFHGKKTANGERYDMYAMSAAHTTLPMPSMVRVTNINNGRSVVVRVNDRGPFAKKRLIDLSYAAAKTLGFDQAGTAPVRVEALGRGTTPNIGNHISRPAVQHPVQPPLQASPATSIARAGAMYIQLGAFSLRSNAMQLKSSLQSNYPSVGIYTVDGGYAEIYRVRIGPFDSEKNIENSVLSLQEQGHNNAIVVIE